MGSVRGVNGRARCGRAERQLRAMRRRMAAAESYETGQWTAGPEYLLELASAAEAAQYSGGEMEPELEERITATLGEGWDVGPEPDVWRKG